MKKILVALTFALVPAVAAAQSAAVSAHAHGAAKVETPRLSADARARMNAQIHAAAARGTPEKPMRRRAAEGEAKGASEAQIAAALTRLEANLQTSARAFARAGRRPTSAEIEAGGEAAAQGASEVELAGLISRAPGERSLEVGLRTLASLAVAGEGVAKAIARIEAQLAAKASDESIASLSGASAGGMVHTGNGSIGIGAGAAGTAGAGATSVTGAAGAAAGGAATVGGAAGGVGGTVTGAVTGGLGRRP